MLRNVWMSVAFLKLNVRSSCTSSYTNPLSSRDNIWHSMSSSDDCVTHDAMNRRSSEKKNMLMFFENLLCFVNISGNVSVRLRKGYVGFWEHIPAVAAWGISVAFWGLAFKNSIVNIAVCVVYPIGHRKCVTDRNDEFGGTDGRSRADSEPWIPTEPKHWSLGEVVALLC